MIGGGCLVRILVFVLLFLFLLFPGRVVLVGFLLFFVPVEVLRVFFPRLPLFLVSVDSRGDGVHNGSPDQEWRGGCIGILDDIN